MSDSATGGFHVNYKSYMLGYMTFQQQAGIDRATSVRVFQPVPAPMH
jgi:hypothetical protein